MMDKLHKGLLVVGFCLILGFLFGGEVVAARSYSASGSFDIGPILEAQMQFTEEMIEEEIAKREILYPGVNSISLSVSDEGVVSGRGRISEYGADWWVWWEGKVEDFSSWGLRNDYSFAFQGEQRGTGLRGEVVAKVGEFGQYSTDRYSWEAGVVGKKVKGKISKVSNGKVFRGKDVEFELDTSEFLEIEMDSEVEEELQEELGKSGVVITGDPEDREEWKTDVLGVNNAYVVVGNKRVPLDDKMVLEPGMVIETEGEDGLAVFTTSTGEHIRLQGDGTRVTLMTTESVEDEQWKEVLDQYTERRSEGSHSFDRSNPNMLRARTPVTVMQAGQMVVKYESGGKQGWWNKAFKSDHEEYSETSSVGFARNTYLNYRGEEVTTMEDSDPVELVFENHSVVEYLYQGDELVIKVYEGEAVAYRINLQTKENEEILRVKEGESVKIDVEKYEKGGESWEKGTFDSEQKSEAVKSLLKESNWWGRLIFKIKNIFKK